MRKTYIKLIILSMVVIAGFSRCNYLEVVPDNTVEISNLFETKDKAYRALSSCYSYMPNFEKFHESMSLAGDEWQGRLDAEVANGRGNTRGEKLMRGWNNADDPILGFWSGSGGAKHLYKGIRICNIFLNGLGDVPNLSDEERADWIAQVKILKAYYHFYLLRLYGPIVLVDKNLEPYSPVEEVRQERKPVEECFQFILNMIDDVLYDEQGNEKEDLYNTRSKVFYGQIDRVIAKAIKAKVLLLRASPLFNGNSEFYGNFLNAQGEPFFPLSFDKEKWKEALDATEIAIEAAEGQGKKLYEYNGAVKFWDQEDWEKSEIIKYCYNNRFSINDPWNDELIWGFSGVDYTGQGAFAHASNLRGDPDLPNTPEFSWQWLGGTYRMTELFYTKNGIPMEEDINFDYTKRHEITDIPEDNYHRGYMQAGEKTIKMHLNREPRFYAWMAVDRCIWRSYDTRVYTKMRSGEWPGGRQVHATDYYWTGIAVKKFVHPESRSSAWQRVVKFPMPIIRLADLYLMYAEAYNEYYGPDQKVYDKLNAIRARAGLLRPIEQIWNDPKVVRTVGKHLDQTGLRDIIHTERLIELSFEGQRYYDILRWKRANEFFTTPIQGWNAPDGSELETFYQLMTWQLRTWDTPKNYLMPIPKSDMNTNPKLIQNPGY